MKELERIATLEEQNRAAKIERDEIKTGIDDLRDTLVDIKKTLATQRGFWAGVTFIASIGVFFIKELWQRLVAE